MNDIEILEKFIKNESMDLEVNTAIENLIQRNKELEEYVNWHIEHLTEDIADYVDDDIKANASLIGELKEEREHWKDIIRIMDNQKTYIDYKNY